MGWKIYFIQMLAQAQNAALYSAKRILSVPEFLVNSYIFLLTLRSLKHPQMSFFETITRESERARECENSTSRSLTQPNTEKVVVGYNNKARVRVVCTNYKVSKRAELYRKEQSKRFLYLHQELRLLFLWNWNSPMYGIYV